MTGTLADGLHGAPSDCARVDAALPWFVNGTLPVAERAVVTQHLARCPGCRQRAAFENKVRDAVQATAQGDDAGARIGAQTGEQSAAQIDAEAAWLRFAPRIESTADATSRRPRRPGGRRLWMIIGAQAAALVLIALLLVIRELQRAEPLYRTVADPPTTVSPVAVGTLLRVVVAPDLPASEVRRIASGLGAVVVTGPNEEQVYTLALNGLDRDSADNTVDAAVAALRAGRGVLLVEEVVR